VGRVSLAGTGGEMEGSRKGKTRLSYRERGVANPVGEANGVELTGKLPVDCRDDLQTFTRVEGDREKRQQEEKPRSHGPDHLQAKIVEVCTLASLPRTRQAGWAGVV
jgi:hypothetical protein